VCSLCEILLRPEFSSCKTHAWTWFSLTIILLYLSIGLLQECQTSYDRYFVLRRTFDNWKGAYTRVMLAQLQAQLTVIRQSRDQVTAQAQTATVNFQRARLDYLTACIARPIKTRQSRALHSWYQQVCGLMWQESLDKREAVHRLHAAAIADHAETVVRQEHAKFRASVTLLQARAQRQVAQLAQRRHFAAWSTYVARKRHIAQTADRLARERVKRQLVASISAWRYETQTQKMALHKARLTEHYRKLAVLRKVFHSWSAYTHRRTAAAHRFHAALQHVLGMVCSALVITSSSFVWSSPMVFRVAIRFVACFACSHQAVAFSTESMEAHKPRASSGERGQSAC
jgi:hypothetical protein